MATAEHHSEPGNPRSSSLPDRVPAAPPLYRLAMAVTMPIVRGPYRLRVRGVEHVPEAGGLVAAANHTSNLDPWPLGTALAPRHVCYMAKSELWWFPLRVVLAALGSFPVRRGQHDVEAFENAVRVVREGRVMGMFPEGTRRRKGLRKKHEPRPHTGAARIALTAGVPLLPAAIRGTDRLSRLGPLRVSFAAPVPLDDLRDLDSYEAARVATERLWREIQRLEAELDAG